MDNLKDKDTLHQVCELDPRYQNLIGAFRQTLKREDIDRVRTYLLILLISCKLLAEEQALFKRYDLSEGKLSVLLLLKNAPQNQFTPSEIAEATQVTRGTMTGLLAGLERDGYVIRKEYPNDGRRCTIQLTEQSISVMDQLLLERFQHIEKLFACFTPSELNEQCAIIEKINYQLKKDNIIA